MSLKFREEREQWEWKISKLSNWTSHINTVSSTILLFHAQIYQDIPKQYTFFRHSPFDGHLGWFHTKIWFRYGYAGISGVHSLGFLQIHVPRSSIAALYNKDIFSYLENLHTGFHSGLTNLDPHHPFLASLFLHPHNHVLFFVLLKIVWLGWDGGLNIFLSFYENESYLIFFMSISYLHIFEMCLLLPFAYLFIELFKTKTSLCIFLHDSFIQPILFL